jgi:hypothetical protein
VSVDVQRQPFYTMRLVVVPLILIVLLSFSVFWMDRSSLGDRLSVSFIGILTGVAYLIVTSEQLPRISYFTLMHGLLNLSPDHVCHRRDQPGGGRAGQARRVGCSGRAATRPAAEPER